MKPPSEYRAWLCDLDGTLYDPRAMKLIMGIELVVFGFAELRTIRCFRQEHERLRREPPVGGGSPFDTQVERTAERLGRTPEEVRASVSRWMIERPCRWLRKFRREALKQEIAGFREGGGVTALVSDYPAARKLMALELSELFDVTVANGEPGGPDALKPAPDGYLKAAERLGIEPRECLVLGDRADADGAAARAAGMAFRLIR